MSIEKVRSYLEPYGVADRIREFEVSSATVQLAAAALGVDEARIAKSLSFHTGAGCMIIVMAGDVKVDICSSSSSALRRACFPPRTRF